MMIKIKPKRYDSIAGVSPEEYAAQWGDGRTHGGAAMYNYGSSRQVKDQSFYDELLQEILRLRGRLGKTAKDRGDSQDLHRLARHIAWERQPRIATFTRFEIAMMLPQALSVSHAGDCETDVVRLLDAG